MKKGFGCLVLLVVLGFGAYGTYRALMPARVGGVAFKELSPQDQKTRRAEAQKLVKNIEDVAHAARKKEHKEFTLTATEPQLNTLLQDRLRTEKFPIDDLRAGIQPDVLTLQGTVKYQGFDVPANLDGRLVAQDGGLVFTIDSLTISGVPAPGKLKEKAEKSIGDGLQKAFGSERNVKVESVKLETGKLTITGKTGN